MQRRPIAATARDRAGAGNGPEPPRPDWSAPRSGCSPATAWHRVRIGGSPGFTAPRHPPLAIEEDVLRPASNDGERHEDSLQLDAVLERRKIVLPEH
jgi:hypothetical protein